MQLSVSTEIDAPADRVWQVITDIGNSGSTIRGILGVEILERPKGGPVKGLKWRETRKFAGKEATEVMWITDAEEPRFYRTRAESHGSVYESGMSIESRDKGCTLTMSFEGRPQTFGAKVLWALTGWIAVRALRKTIRRRGIGLPTLFRQASSEILPGDDSDWGTRFFTDPEDGSTSS